LTYCISIHVPVNNIYTLLKLLSDSTVVSWIRVCYVLYRNRPVGPPVPGISLNLGLPCIWEGWGRGGHCSRTDHCCQVPARLCWVRSTQKVRPLEEKLSCKNISKAYSLFTVTTRYVYVVRNYWTMCVKKFFLYISRCSVIKAILST
jgi:hypothetical protein